MYIYTYIYMYIYLILYIYIYIYRYIYRYNIGRLTTRYNMPANVSKSCNNLFNHVVNYKFPKSRKYDFPK